MTAPVDPTILWPRRGVVVALVVVAAIVWRVVKPGIGVPWNLELLTSSAFLASALLPRFVSPLAPLVAAIVSDLFLGNDASAWFTWSAWAIIGLASLLTRRYRGNARWWAAGAFGLGGTLFFFVYTNFGFWVLYPQYYAPGPAGLAASYVAGLPFLWPQLIGNLILVPLVGAGLATLVERAERGREVRAGVVAR